MLSSHAMTINLLRHCCRLLN